MNCNWCRKTISMLQFQFSGGLCGGCEARGYPTESEERTYFELVGKKHYYPTEYPDEGYTDNDSEAVSPDKEGR